MKKLSDLNLYIGLVHGPIRNKQGNEITTSVTNLDIHDIARSARTFGFKRYHIITPILKQQQLVGKLLEHWHQEENNEYNPDRSSALSFVTISNTIEEAKAEITKIHGVSPMVVVTGANFKEYNGDTQELMRLVQIDNRPMFLLFGTGWGLTASVTDSADYKLTPIFGSSADNYNHLSVRSAVAIYCDRLARSL